MSSLTDAKRNLWAAIQNLCTEWAAGDLTTREQLAQRKSEVNDELGRLVQAAWTGGNRASRPASPADEPDGFHRCPACKGSGRAP